MRNSKSLGLWKVASRNLLRNRRRTTATGIAIVFGYVGMLLLSAYIYRAAMGMRANTVYNTLKGHVAIFKAGSLDGFTNKPWRFVISADDRKQIDEAVAELGNKVEFSGGFLEGFGLLNNKGRSAPVMITGVDPDLYFKLMTHPDLLYWTRGWVRGLDTRDINKMKENPNLVSLTTGLAHEIGEMRTLETLQGNDRDVQLIGQNYYKDVNAVDAELGLTHKTGNALVEELSMIAPLSLLQNLYATDGVEYVALFIKHPLQAHILVRRLKKKLGDRFEYLTYDDERWAPYYVGTMNFLYVMGQFFVVLILGAVALAIVNTTTLNLLERSRETGTLRAIGFSPMDLKKLFVREALILCSVAIVIGGTLAWLIAFIVDSVNIQFSPPGVPGTIQFMLELHPLIAALMGLLVLGITVVSTSIVVNRQTKIKVVSLLTDSGA